MTFAVARPPRERRCTYCGVMFLTDRECDRITCSDECLADSVSRRSAMISTEPRPSLAFSGDQRWRARANCRSIPKDDGTPMNAAERTALFFSSGVDNIAAARAICGLCPVAKECAQAALEGREEFGVWAGTYRTKRTPRRERIDGG